MTCPRCKSRRRPLRAGFGGEGGIAGYSLMADQDAQRSVVLIAGVPALVPLVALAERLANSFQITPDTRSGQASLGIQEPRTEPAFATEPAGRVPLDTPLPPS